MLSWTNGAAAHTTAREPVRCCIRRCGRLRLCAPHALSGPHARVWTDVCRRSQCAPTTGHRHRAPALHGEPPTGSVWSKGTCRGVPYLRQVVVFRCALAALRCDLGQLEEARDLLDELAGEHLAHLPERQEWFLRAGLLAEVCARLGDRARAPTLYELCLPYAGCNLLNWPEVSADSTSRYLGLLATAMSRWQDAERHFVAAIEMDRRTGRRPWLAHGQQEYARMLLARGSTRRPRAGPRTDHECTSHLRATGHAHPRGVGHTTARKRLRPSSVQVTVILCGWM
jgi:hypothetical protein